MTGQFSVKLPNVPGEALRPHMLQLVAALGDQPLHRLEHLAIAHVQKHVGRESGDFFHLGQERRRAQQQRQGTLLETSAVFAPLHHGAGALPTRPRDGRRPTAIEVRSGRYPLGYPLVLLTPSDAAREAERWIAHALGNRGRQVIERRYTAPR